MSHNQRPNRPNQNHRKPLSTPINEPPLNATNTKPFSRGWRYYAGMTAGVFLGAIAANIILSLIFRPNRATNDPESQRNGFSIQSGVYKDGEKVYSKDVYNPYDELSRHLGESKRS